MSDATVTQNSDNSGEERLSEATLNHKSQDSRLQRLSDVTVTLNSDNSGKERLSDAVHRIDTLYRVQIRCTASDKRSLPELSDFRWVRRQTNAVEWNTENFSWVRRQTNAVDCDRGYDN